MSMAARVGLRVAVAVATVAVAVTASAMPAAARPGVADLYPGTSNRYGTACVQYILDEVAGRNLAI